jgi:hypothetical protein
MRFRDQRDPGSDERLKPFKGVQTPLVSPSSLTCDTLVTPSRRSGCPIRPRASSHFLSARDDDARADATPAQPTLISAASNRTR